MANERLEAVGGRGTLKCRKNNAFGETALFTVEQEGLKKNCVPDEQREIRRIVFACAAPVCTKPLRSVDARQRAWGERFGQKLVMEGDE